MKKLYLLLPLFVVGFFMFAPSASAATLFTWTGSTTNIADASAYLFEGYTNGYGGGCTTNCSITATGNLKTIDIKLKSQTTRGTVYMRMLNDLGVNVGCDSDEVDTTGLADGAIITFEFGELAPGDCDVTASDIRGFNIQPGAGSSASDLTLYGAADGSATGKVYQVWSSENPAPSAGTVTLDYIASQNTPQSQGIYALTGATTTIPFGNVNSWYVNFDAGSSSTITTATPGIVRVAVGQSPSNLVVLNTAYVYETSTDGFTYGKVVSNWNTYAAGTWYAKAFLYDHATSTDVGTLIASSSIEVFVVQEQDVSSDPNLPGLDCSIYPLFDTSGTIPWFADTFLDGLSCQLTNILNNVTNYLFTPGPTSQQLFTDALNTFKGVFPFNLWFSMRDTVAESVDAGLESEQSISFTMSYPEGTTSSVPLFNSTVISSAVGNGARDLWYNFVLLLTIAMLSWSILRIVYHYVRQ